ncbi:MAG: DUF5117 domain-containing protein, partial [Aureibaculum sp.]
MFKQITNTLLIVLFVFFITTDTQAQKKSKKKKSKDAVEAPAEKPKPKKDEILAYDKVITKEAKTDDGLFKVHEIDEKYFYEIPDSLLEREMLMVTRISKTASGIGFGGGKQNTEVLRWQKHGKKILLRVVSHDIVAADSLPVHEAVVNSNFEPVLYAFPIKTFSKDSTATVIDVTDLFLKDISALGFPDRRRKQYKITRLDDSRSYIERLDSYPLNIEARHVKTYNAGEPPSNASTGSISIELSNSMILLPKEPMKRRMFDE